MSYKIIRFYFNRPGYRRTIIRPYLTTMDGKKVTSIEVIPDRQEQGVFPDFPERKGMNIRVYHEED